MLSKLAVRRLTKLANFMQEIPRKEWKFFDMHKTGFSGCGTAACAAGWGERVPSFERLGYTFSNSANFFNISADGDHSAWAKLFYSEAAFSCKTPKQWAKHCRKFIKTNS